MDDFKRNQIPAFGNWDYSDGLPITQYFESARQAGLVRYSYGEEDLYGSGGVGVGYDLYTTAITNHDDLLKKPTAAITVVPRRKAKSAEKQYTHHQYHHQHGYANNNNGKEQKKQARVYDLTEQPRQQHHHHHSTVKQHRSNAAVAPPNPKAVDEDLYKIPPELLYTQPKKKKMFGFFSKCLVPTCAV